MGNDPSGLLTGPTGSIPNERSPPFTHEQASAPFREVFVPRLDRQGDYQLQNEGRRMRVSNAIGTRLMSGDFFPKMRLTLGAERSRRWLPF
jgi:hypothetical protein